MGLFFRSGDLGRHYWALITSVFVHFALWHVAFNVYWLWVLGSQLRTGNWLASIPRLFCPVCHNQFVIATCRLRRHGYRSLWRGLCNIRLHVACSAPFSPVRESFGSANGQSVCRMARRLCCSHVFRNLGSRECRSHFRPVVWCRDGELFFCWLQATPDGHGDQCVNCQCDCSTLLLPVVRDVAKQQGLSCSFGSAYNEAIALYTRIIRADPDNAQGIRQSRRHLSSLRQFRTSAGG